MAYDPQEAALHRLERLDERYEYRPVPVSGSPGGQMFSAILFPGVAAMGRHPVTGMLLFLFGIICPVAFVGLAYINRADLVSFGLNSRVLWAVIGLGIAFILTRLLAVVEVSSTFSGTRNIGGKTTLALMAVLLMALPVLMGVYRSNVALSAVGNVFAGGSVEPVFDGGSPADVQTILLLGGDSGPGRWGMRTDSMILAIVDRRSNRMALVSIPRSLSNLRFPPGTPMGDEFPNGYKDNADSMTNAIFTYLDSNPSIRDSYAGNGLLPQAVALSEGIGYSLGITVDDYALVNMQGFSDIIDAVGGVTVNLDQAIPLPPVAGAEVPPSIGPGEVHLTGPLAIAYSRSRELDSDYGRMARQRELLAMLGSQVSPTEAARGFSEVTGVLDDSMRTSLTSSEFSNLLNRMGDSASIGESVGLNPPLVKPGNPNYDEIKVIMDGVENYVLTGEPSGYAS